MQFTSSSLIHRTKKSKQLFFQLLIGMLGATIVLLFFHVVEPPRQIVTVDVTGLINHFVKQEAGAKLPVEQLRKQVNAFGQALDTTLKTLARDHQLILLPKEAVIAGAKDITQDVEAKVNAQLASNK